MNSSNPNYLSKAPSPDTFIVGVRASVYEMWGNRTQAIESIFIKGCSIFCHLLNCKISGVSWQRGNKKGLGPVLPALLTSLNYLAPSSLSFLICKTERVVWMMSEALLAESAAACLLWPSSSFPPFPLIGGESPKAEFVDPCTSCSYLFPLLGAKEKRGVWDFELHSFDQSHPVYFQLCRSIFEILMYVPTHRHTWPEHKSIWEKQGSYWLFPSVSDSLYTSSLITQAFDSIRGRIFEDKIPMPWLTVELRSPAWDPLAVSQGLFGVPVGFPFTLFFSPIDLRDWPTCPGACLHCVLPHPLYPRTLGKE